MVETISRKKIPLGKTRNDKSEFYTKSGVGTEIWLRKDL